MLTVLDLFSGIGGFSLGLERTGGFKTIAFCEIDPFCRRVLAKHWPGVPIYEDVTTAHFTAGQADVICGGFPCQDISIAGKRAGISGERSGLWRNMVDAIRVVGPRYVIVENVAAILFGDLGTVLSDLAAIRYDAEWHCISASEVGAEHRRDRWWAVAYPMREGLEGVHKKGWGEHLQSIAADIRWNGRATPEIYRKVDGIPKPVDRLRALGKHRRPPNPGTHRARYPRSGKQRRSALPVWFNRQSMKLNQKDSP